MTQIGVTDEATLPSMQHQHKIRLGLARAGLGREKEGDMMKFTEPAPYDGRGKHTVGDLFEVVLCKERGEIKTGLQLAIYHIEDALKAMK